MTDRSDGVVLLHGISRTSRSLRRMQTAIEAAGFATLNIGYASRRKTLERLAEQHPSRDRAFRRRHRRLDPFRRPFHGRPAGAGLSRQIPAEAARPRGDARHPEWRQRDRRPPKGIFALSRLVRPGRTATRHRQGCNARASSCRRSIIPSASSPETARSIRSRRRSCRSRMTDGCRWRIQSSTAWPITS